MSQQQFYIVPPETVPTFSEILAQIRNKPVRPAPLEIDQVRWIPPQQVRTKEQELLDQLLEQQFRSMCWSIQHGLDYKLSNIGPRGTTEQPPATD